MTSNRVLTVVRGSVEYKYYIIADFNEIESGLRVMCPNKMSSCRMLFQ